MFLTENGELFYFGKSFIMFLRQPLEGTGHRPKTDFVVVF